MRPIQVSGSSEEACSSIHFFHITLRNKGPVDAIIVIYGSSQLRSAPCRDSMTRRKNGCCGIAPITSLDIPVGIVRRKKALYESKGSSFLLHPSSRSR